MNSEATLRLSMMLRGPFWSAGTWYQNENDFLILDLFVSRFSLPYIAKTTDKE